MRNTGWKIHLTLLQAIIRKNILEYRRYPLEIAFTFLMPLVWFLPSNFLVQTLAGVQNPPQVFPCFFLAISLAIPITYFIDIIRVHTLNIKPLIAYGLELYIFLAASLLFPIVGIWLFNYIDRKCRIQGSLHVH